MGAERREGAKQGGGALDASGARAQALGGRCEGAAARRALGVRVRRARAPRARERRALGARARRARVLRARERRALGARAEQEGVKFETLIFLFTAGARRHGGGYGGP